MVHHPYTTCLRLIATVGGYWQAVDGEAALQGVDLWALPPHRFFHALRHWLLTHIPHDRVEEVERGLDMPAGGYKRRGEGRQMSDLEASKDAEAFVAFAGMLGVKPAN